MGKAESFYQRGSLNCDSGLNRSIKKLFKFDWNNLISAQKSLPLASANVTFY
jgi:hypothetical protein